MTLNTKPLADTLSQSHTFREIMAQPTVWRSWSDNLAGHAESISQWVSTQDFDEIWLSGAGTSAFIGETLAVYLNSVAARANYRAIATTDFVSAPKSYIRAGQRVLVISFGRSGNSPETVAMLDILDEHAPEFARLQITCNASGALCNRQVPGPGEQRTLLLPAQTNDQGFAMTSSYSTMLLSALAVLDSNPPIELAEAIAQLAVGAQAVLGQAYDQALNAGSLPSRAVFLGSGRLKGSARESALKVLELTAGKIPTLWDSTLGFRHGPKAFVDKDTLIFALISADPHTRRYDWDAVDEIKRQYGPKSVLTIGAQKESVDFFVPDVGNDAWSSVLFVLVAQIQAVVWADKLDLNIDNPFSNGNLSRVVQGVTIYPLKG